MRASSLESASSLYGRDWITDPSIGSFKYQSAWLESAPRGRGILNTYSAQLDERWAEGECSPPPSRRAKPAADDYRVKRDPNSIPNLKCATVECTPGAGSENTQTVRALE